MIAKRESWMRTFLIIFIGQAFSLLGSAAVNFALVWWLTAETGSAVILAYASIAAILPQALLSPLVGPFIDRWDRRLTIIIADIAIALSSVGLILMFSAGKPTIWAIITVIGLRSLGATFHTPASQAAVPMYVPSEHLMKVAGWNFFLGSGVAMAGPVLGAFLMGVAPITIVIGVDIVGAIIAVGCLAVVRIPHPEKAVREDGRQTSIVEEFTDGWHELTRNKGLFELTLVLAVITLVYMPLNALFPLMTRSHFDGTALMASIAEFAFGLGMLIGSMLIGILSVRFSGVRLIVSGIVVLGFSVALSGILPSSAFWLYVALCLGMGFSAPLFSAPITAMFQLLIDPAKLGRVMSLYITIAMVMTPLGLLIAGPLADEMGIARWFGISGVFFVISGGAIWLMPKIRGLDQAVAEATDVAEAATMAEASSGIPE